MDEGGHQEFFEGKPFVGSVVTTQWSDWALVPLEKEKGGKVTILLERQLDSLWVYIMDEKTGRKMEVRRITWWFYNDILDQKVTSDNRRLLIGVYAARPKVPVGEGRENEELAVEFEGFEVKLSDD